MPRTFDEDLKEALEDPESTTYFANSRAESEKEMLKSGVWTSLNSTSLSDKPKHFRIEKWR